MVADMNREPMSLEQARRVIRSSGRLGELAEAIGTLIDEPAATVDDLLAGLRHPGVVAEQAALALYRRTGRPIPAGLDAPDLAEQGWREWFNRSGIADRETPGVADHGPSDGVRREHRETITKSALVRRLAAECRLEPNQVRDVLGALAKAAYKHARNGFTLPGIGKLILVNRKARLGRNPMTGETIRIPARKVVKFRISKAAKDAVLGCK